MLSFQMRAAVPPHVYVTQLDSEAVILDLRSGRYFSLDEVGARMWSRLSTSDTIQTAFDNLLSEYDVESDTLRRDLDEFVTRLVERGLMEVGVG